MQTGINAILADAARFNTGTTAQAIQALNWQHSLTPVIASQQVDVVTQVVSVPNYTPGQPILCNLQAMNPQALYEQTGIVLKEPHRATFAPQYAALFVVGNRMQDGKAMYEVASAASPTTGNALLTCGDYAEAILERLFWL